MPGEGGPLGRGGAAGGWPGGAGEDDGTWYQGAGLLEGRKESLGISTLSQVGWSSAQSGIAWSSFHSLFHLLQMQFRFCKDFSSRRRTLSIPDTAICGHLTLEVSLILSMCRGGVYAISSYTKSYARESIHRLLQKTWEMNAVQMLYKGLICIPWIHPMENNASISNNVRFRIGGIGVYVFVYLCISVFVSLCICVSESHDFMWSGVS